MPTTTIPRRRFLARGAAGLAGLAGLPALAAAACAADGADAARTVRNGLRDLFRLDPDHVHLAGLLLASHPEPVREAIAAHRRALDRNPAAVLHDRYNEIQEDVRAEAADYLRVDAEGIALTDSTTMGLSFLYGDVRIRSDQEFLTTEHDHYATHASVEVGARRTGASVRRVALYERSARATADEVVGRLLEAIRMETRVVAVTWVQSDTGLKLPLHRVADGLAERNRDRDPEDRALLCVDGVHGLGVEDEGPEALGCDFFAAGTHKWLLGPRGTGILWGRPEVREAVSPTIPTFTPGRSWGERMTPGGFKAFEHLWALGEAFAFHRGLGRGEVRDHIHALAERCKRGLEAMGHVRLHTPMDAALSAGIVCFEVDGRTPAQVVEGLGERGVVASVTPYDRPYARLAPALWNDEEEIDRALAAVEALA